jgi:hypothetical protein
VVERVRGRERARERQGERNERERHGDTARQERQSESPRQTERRSARLRETHIDTQRRETALGPALQRDVKSLYPCRGGLFSDQQGRELRNERGVVDSGNSIAL